MLTANAALIRDTLVPIFHKDMVIRGPEMTLMAQGREAAIQSYADFAARSEVLSFEADPVEVEVFDDMAVAKCRWTMRYRTGAAESAAAGTDSFMFVLEDGRWQVAWRALLEDPA